MTDHLTHELRDHRAKLEGARRASLATYNATWREHPTAKGFPLVDKALAKLHEAEHELSAFDVLHAPPRRAH